MLPLLLFTASACINADDYSTKPGECFRGTAIDAPFLSSEALTVEGEELTMVLVLDAKALGNGQPGTTITTSDNTFYQSQVTQLPQLSHDSLSLFQFPVGRMRNYLAHGIPSDGIPATVIVSLMENEDQIEVRVLRPDEDPADALDSSMFGVFRLVREKNCADPVIPRP